MFYEKTEITVPDICPPHNLAFGLSHYILPPESREKDCLVQIIRLTSGRILKVDVVLKGTVEHPSLELTIWSREPLTSDEIREAKEAVSWHLCLREDLEPFYSIVADDPILNASIMHNFGAKDKASYSMFNALIDCICSQNTNFRRLYSMMENLAASLGDKIVFGGKAYFAFPTPKELAQASVEKLRTCKVGYRAKLIERLAEVVVANVINLENVKTLPLEEARSRLMELPGVGPYTADLSLIIGARRLNILHIDLFIREVLTQFYLNGRKVSDNELREFANERWGPYQAYAAFYLTTDTEIWARKNMKKFRLRSGAQR